MPARAWLSKIRKRRRSRALWTLSVISFSRNDASYLSRPRLRNHPPMFMWGSLIRKHDRFGKACLVSKS
jgi:hypothetical protein